jgi:hypothetical protein
MTLKYFAKDAAGNSEGVKDQSYTLNLIPPPPTGIALSNMKTAGPTVSWNAVSGATYYNVYRSPDGAAWAQIGNATAASFVDTTAPRSNTTYYWTVTANNESGESSKPSGVPGRTALLDGWNQVSAPYATSGQSPTEVYGAWATWTWAWVSKGNTDPDRSGYWHLEPAIYPGLSELVAVTNDSTVINSTVTTANTTPLDVTLVPGWNLISNPTTSNMTNIGANWLVDGTALSSAITAVSPIIGGAVYWWNGSTYDSWNVADNPVVEPWKGYLILNLDGVSHTLTIK